MFAFLFALLLLAPPARSETVLEFVGGCRESELGPCFERIRSELDRGTLWLLDDRYRRPEVSALLPPSWRLG